MASILFYEKPGCIGNRRQKSLLRSHGYRLVVRDLLAESWTADSLRPYFADTPVAQWFNLSAPKIKSGEIKVDLLDEASAIQLMLDEPLLICRPLLQYGACRQSGFYPGPVLANLKVRLDPQEDLQSCPGREPMPVCGVAV